MNQFIESKRSEIDQLCARHHVRRLEVFGSFTGEGFNPETSDLDFLVEFHDLPEGHYADAYLGLLEALEQLFSRPVDLLITSAIKNPYLVESIQQSRVVLYAA